MNHRWRMRVRRADGLNEIVVCRFRGFRGLRFKQKLHCVSGLLCLAVLAPRVVFSFGFTAIAFVNEVADGSEYSDDEQEFQRTRPSYDHGNTHADGNPFHPPVAWGHHPVDDKAPSDDEDEIERRGHGAGQGGNWASAVSRQK